MLRASGDPVVVNAVSGVGWPRALRDPSRDEFPVQAVPYASSKAAVITATVQYAKAQPRLRINAADPGCTATDLNAHSGHRTVTEGTDARSPSRCSTRRGRPASSTTGSAASTTDRG